MFIARSSLNQTNQPGKALEASVGWLVELLTGNLAVTLCVVAVALLGFALLSGRVSVQRGLSTALGAFILLAAPTVAAGFAQIWQGQDAIVFAPEVAPTDDLPPRGVLKPADYDPYAGASIRDN